MSGIHEAVAAGRVCREPSYSTPIRYFERPEITPVPLELIQQSALPLRDVEVDFAQDSSGFASTAYHRWFDEKWGKGSQKAVKWVKLHIMCGVCSNIVTVPPPLSRCPPTHPSCRISCASPPRTSASTKSPATKPTPAARTSWPSPTPAAHLTSPFARTSKASGVSMSKPEVLWRQMYHLFTLHEDEFNEHYHKRSNVETCFHMMKAKFGDKVRAKTPTAQINEVLLKVLCHNICCIIRAMYVLNITPVFDAGFSSETAPDEKVSDI